MSSWSLGYRTDIDYTYGFYRELTPAMLSFAALLGGVRSTLSGPFTYCELGCGKGFSTNLFAAANPDATFYATDFNPGHTAEARALAAESKLCNAHFFDAGFEEFAGHELPQFDAIVAHGVLSWIGDEARRALIRFIGRKLKIGGIVYVSYNALPGSAAMAPIRDLLMGHAAGAQDPIERRIERALDFAQKLKAAGALHFHHNPAAANRLERLRTQSPKYIAHEYLNADWKLFHHGDMVRELSEAKLSFVASGYILDHAIGANLTPPQREVVTAIQDPVLREMARDYCVNQQFRRDVFVKGPLAHDLHQQAQRIADQRFVLSTPTATGTETTIKSAAGEVKLKEEMYRPILEALEQPRTMRELMAMPAGKLQPHGRLREMLTLMVGAGYVQPCPEAPGDSARAVGTASFNLAVAERAARTGELQYFASPVTAGGHPVDRMSQLFQLGVWNGQTDLPGYAWGRLQALGQSLSREGKRLETPEENMAAVKQAFDKYQAEVLPVLKRLGAA